jgi:hypothetical protein
MGSLLAECCALQHFTFYHIYMPSEILLSLKFDGTDEQRLKTLLSQQAFFLILDETFKHIWWWRFECSGERRQAYQDVINLIEAELDKHEPSVCWDVLGKIRNLNGELVEKTELPRAKPQTPEGKQAQVSQSAP